MRIAVLCLAALLLSEGEASSQVLVQAPSDIVAYIPCAMPIFPHNIEIRYRMLNVRPGNLSGTFKLYYKAAHANEGPLDAPHRARFLSADVDVAEEFSDMGVWIMRSDPARNRWIGECARRANGLHVLYGVDILGRLQQVEPAGSCPDETRHPTYDPYEPSGPSGGECDDGSGGGDSGSGTYYSEGDYTGGELVDWQTGMGIGGSSECGARAQVDYVCFDYWDGNQWVVWTCGYATTC